jgi:hypothetical protein
MELIKPVTMQSFSMLGKLSTFLSKCSSNSLANRLHYAYTVVRHQFPLLYF